MSTEALRPELPPDIPPGIEKLPRHRGYPVPWFVADMPEGEPPDFRVMGAQKVRDAVSRSKCWICGGHMLAGSRVAYVAGPMCGINRNSAEPPGHIICADWSARACPFLARPHAKRREEGLPEDGAYVPGAITRNPGVAMVWITDEVKVRHVPQATYFDLGMPREVRWYCEGRAATRDEVETSVSGGLPTLMGVCTTADDRAALRRAVERFFPLLPAE